MATMKQALTPAPVNVGDALSLDAGTSYMLQNVSASRRVFVSETDDANAPDTADAPAIVLQPLEKYFASTPAAPGALWAWAEGPAGAALIVNETAD